MNKLPRWLLISVLVVAVCALITGLVFMIRSDTPWVHWTGVIVAFVVIAIIIFIATTFGPKLIKLYKFQKHLSNREDDFRSIYGLANQGKAHEAAARFNSLMKGAPDSAYIYYMKAVFMKNTGNMKDSYDAAKNALYFADRDPSLAAQLQQGASQLPGQPTTLAEFKAELQVIIAELEPKMKEIQLKKEKAVQKRKKKSR